jgi:predicted DCC family thiol-disulfide oxidoreductase YuxK
MNSPIILFDGVCNFCNFWVNLILKYDKEKKFRFASIQSDFAKKFLEENKITTLGIDSIVLIIEGKVFLKSSAVVQIAKNLSGILKLLYYSKFIPISFRDSIYDFVARNRYKWFGRREVCRVPAEEEKTRFLS